MPGPDPTPLAGGTDGMTGVIINNYRILGPIGQGGMGTVYLAEHPFIGRKAAVKVLKADFAAVPDVVERFMNEARAAHAIHHPNIIDIIDVGRLPSTLPYLMMEFLEGGSLGDRIARQGRRSVDEAIELATQTAGALAAAHDKGIVHRDLKPDNIFVIPDPSNPSGMRVKILDFGIAKLRADVAINHKTTTNGTRMGSPYYMSPEQWGGQPNEIDGRTDIYALGIVLFEMLAGAPPFVADRQEDLMIAHVMQPLPSLRAANPLVPEGLEAVIVKATAKKRDERFATMADMQVALRTSRVPAGIAPVAATIVMAPKDRSSVPAQPLPTPPPIELPIRSGRLTTLGGAAVQAGGGSTAVVSEQVRGKFKLWIPVAAIAAAATAFLIFAKAKNSEPAPGQQPSAQVHVQITSVPPGAHATDLTRGGVLGTTPFDVVVDRRTTPIEVVLELPGFEPKRISVSLEGDFHAEEQLQHLASPSPAPGPPPTPAAGEDKPTNARSGTKRHVHKSGGGSTGASDDDEEKQL